MSRRLAFSLMLGIGSLALFAWPITALFATGSIDFLAFGLVVGAILLHAASYNLSPELFSRTASFGPTLVIFGLTLIIVDFGKAHSSLVDHEHATLAFGILAIVSGAPLLFIDRFKKTSAHRE